MSSEATPRAANKNQYRGLLIGIGIVVIIGALLTLSGVLLQSAGDQSKSARKESIEQTYDLTYLRDATSGDAGNDPVSSTGNGRFIAESEGKSFNCQLPSESMIAKKAVLSCNPVELLTAK